MGHLDPCLSSTIGLLMHEEALRITFVNSKPVHSTCISVQSSSLYRTLKV